MSIFSVAPTHGYLGDIPDKELPNVVIVNGVPRKIVKLQVYEFSMGDVEDPVLYMSEPLINWEKSEQGKYIISRAVETPVWHQYLSHTTYTTTVKIIAKLYEEDATYYTLKYL